MPSPPTNARRRGRRCSWKAGARGARWRWGSPERGGTAEIAAPPEAGVAELQRMETERGELLVEARCRGPNCAPSLKPSGPRGADPGRGRVRRVPGEANDRRKAAAGAGGKASRQRGRQRGPKNCVRPRANARQSSLVAASPREGREAAGAPPKPEAGQAQAAPSPAQATVRRNAKNRPRWRSWLQFN